MRIAILGGGSCFAMNLARHLVRRGDNVLGISRSPMRGKAFTLGLENEPSFTYVPLHLVFDFHKLMAQLDAFEPDIVVNFAALCEVGLSWKHALDYYQTNLIGLVRLTNELYTRSWFRRFVQIGSSEVYGSVTKPAREDTAWNPSSPYATSKAAFDFHLRAIAKHEGFPALIVMPGNGYCEGQTVNRIIPRTIISVINGTKLKLQGGGVAKKSYLHGDDISRAIMLCMENGAVGEIYNCGPQVPISIADLVGMISGMMGKTLEDVAEIAPERTGQDSQYWLDSRKIEAMGWRADINIVQGLRRMIDWVRTYPELLSLEADYRHKP